MYQGASNVPTYTKPVPPRLWQSLADHHVQGAFSRAPALRPDRGNRPQERRRADSQPRVCQAASSTYACSSCDETPLHHHLRRGRRLPLQEVLDLELVPYQRNMRLPLVRSPLRGESSPGLEPGSILVNAPTRATRRRPKRPAVVSLIQFQPESLPILPYLRALD